MTDFFRQCSGKAHENTEKTTSARNRILSVETYWVRTLGDTTISPSLDRALPSLRHHALLGKQPEIGDISSKEHDFVFIDENRACRPRLAPQCLHSLVRPCAFFLCFSSLFFHQTYAGARIKKQNVQRKKIHWLSVPDHLTDK